MTLVHMADRRIDSKRRNGSKSADTQYELLFQPHLNVAAIQLIGDILVSRAVRLNIRIEEIKWHSPNLRPPDMRVEFSAGESH